VLATSTPDLSGAGQITANLDKLITESQTPELAAAAVQMAVASLSAEVARSIAPRIYLHTASRADSDALRQRRGALSTQGYILLGPQSVGERAPAVTEVRYFTAAGEATAQNILGMLQSAGVEKGRISLERPTASDLKASRDIASHFEVWFAPGDPGRLPVTTNLKK
jgi:hypothetical protein